MIKKIWKEFTNKISVLEEEVEASGSGLVEYNDNPIE